MSIYSSLSGALTITGLQIMLFACSALIIQSSIDFKFLLLAVLVLLLLVLGLVGLLLCSDSMAVKLGCDQDLYCLVVILAIVSIVSGTATGTYIGVYS